jgi:hypothetical protein
VKRLVHVTNEMYQELEGLTGNRVTGIVVHPVLKQFRGVLDRIKNVATFGTSPTMRARKSTCLRGVVVNRAYVVERCRPTHMDAVLVGPCGDRRYVALAQGKIKNFAKGWEHRWVQVHLCNCCDYFMT